MEDTFCPQCGWDVEVDEDHCCIHCGATASGEGVDNLVIQYDRLRKERDRLIQLVYDIFESLPDTGEDGPCPVCWTYTHKTWCYYERLKKAVEKME